MKFRTVAWWHVDASASAVHAVGSARKRISEAHRGKRTWPEDGSWMFPRLVTALGVLFTNFAFLSPLTLLFVALRALAGTCWCVYWTYHTLARVPSGVHV